MTKKDLKNIKKTLQAEKAELEESLAKIAKKDPHHKDDYDARFRDFGEDVEDQAQETAQYADNIALENNLEVQLIKTKNALARIKAGTFGKCTRCASGIPSDRLRAMPAASRCVKCENK